MPIVGISGKRGLTLEDRFWLKVNKTDTCWLWTGARKESGHGVIGLGKREQGLVRAHRLSWTIHNGNIPKGMLVCHKCDNPPCVNPDHLFLGSQLDNVRDCIQKGRKIDPPYKFGEGIGNHKLSEKEVLEIRELGNWFTQRELGKIYKVTHCTVGYILRRKIWKHL